MVWGACSDLWSTHRYTREIPNLQYAPCNGVVRYGAEIGGLWVFADHTRKIKRNTNASKILTRRAAFYMCLSSRYDCSRCRWHIYTWRTTTVLITGKPEDPQYESHAGIKCVFHEKLTNIPIICYMFYKQTKFSSKHQGFPRTSFHIMYGTFLIYLISFNFYQFSSHFSQTNKQNHLHTCKTELWPSIIIPLLEHTFVKAWSSSKKLFYFILFYFFSFSAFYFFLLLSQISIKIFQSTKSFSTILPSVNFFLSIKYTCIWPTVKHSYWIGWINNSFME